LEVVDRGSDWEFDYVVNPEGKVVKKKTKPISLPATFKKGQNIPNSLIDSKPKNSPVPDKWLEKNGEIIIHAANDWTYDDNSGHVVRYPGGYPDFKSAGFVEGEVNIAKELRANGEGPMGMEGDRSNDFRKALRAKGSILTIGCTWHHHQDKETMQEVITKWHKLFTHMGGVSLKTGRGIGEDSDD
jgi:hypothetical protein